MTQTFVPQTFVPRGEAEVVETVRWAIAGKQSLAISGSGSKFGWGRPPEHTAGPSASLSLTALDGIDLYEPEELVLSARAGTKMSELEQRLAQHGQQLAFEPPDLGPLFGLEAGQGTLGGAIGCNLSGPRRISAGAARDHVLGFAGVNGLAESFKAGGRVVKNVTGFDLSKLLSGSFGTLAVMTHITLKVLPAPEDSCSILVFGADANAAIPIMGAAMQSPHEIGGAAYLPARVAARSRVAPIAQAGKPVVVLRLEGATPSVAARSAALKDLLRDRGEIADLTMIESRAVWREIRDVAPYVDAVPGGGTRAIWHISVPPAAGAKIAAEIADRDDDLYFDWGGGRLWLASTADVAAAAMRIRGAVAAVGGHATLIRAAEEARRIVPVFQPLSRAEAALIGRLKDNFDPHRIFNPGRMYEGL
jgi:glycolate oxidase FAD binding subunit